MNTDKDPLITCYFTRSELKQFEKLYTDVSNARVATSTLAHRFSELFEGTGIKLEIDSAFYSEFDRDADLQWFGKIKSYLRRSKKESN